MIAAAYVLRYDEAREQDRLENMWRQEGQEPPTHLRDFLDLVEGPDIPDADSPTASVIEMKAFFDTANRLSGGREQ